MALGTVVAALLGAAAGAGGGGTAGTAVRPAKGGTGSQVPRFGGEVRVEERPIVFQPPPARMWRPDDLDPEDLLVSEDGRLRRVTRVEPLAGAARPWTLLVWVDRRLASPETTFRATLALAKRARELADLGPVEVVVADPAPRTAAAATREARRLELVLSDLAGAARVERDRIGDRWRPPPPEQLQALARTQFDRLVVDLAARPARGPRALLLVTEAAAPEAGRLLAGYGWVTLPLPVRQAAVDDPRRPVSDADRGRRSTEEGWNDATVPPPIDGGIVIPPRRRRGGAALPEIADLYVTPDLAPLRDLVAETGGHLIGVEEQLAPALASLTERWLVWLDVPAEEPADRLRRLEMRTLRGEPLRTFRWTAAGTPPELAAARRRLNAPRPPSPESLDRADPPRKTPPAAGGRPPPAVRPEGAPSPSLSGGCPAPPEARDRDGLPRGDLRARPSRQTPSAMWISPKRSRRRPKRSMAARLVSGEVLLTTSITHRACRGSRRPARGPRRRSAAGCGGCRGSGGTPRAIGRRARAPSPPTDVPARRDGSPAPFAARPG